MKQALRVLQFLAKGEIATGKLELRPVSGMTIEERASGAESA